MELFEKDAAYLVMWRIILLLDIFSCTDMVVPTICILQSLHTIFILHS